MSKHRITHTIQMSSGWDGEITLEVSEDSGEDPVFSSLLFDGEEYSHVDIVSGNGCPQWMYLVSPEAFESALRGTSLEAEMYACYDHEECRLIKTGKELRWELRGVTHLVSMCCCDGVAADPRDFDLIFS